MNQRERESETCEQNIHSCSIDSVYITLPWCQINEM